MYKALKIELKLTVAQKIQVCQTIGTERFIYNEYIKYNQEQYELGNKFVSANDFSKYINNVYLPNNPDKKWIKDVSSKSVKQAMIYGEKAFKNFFKGLSAFPVFKKKGKNELGAYFVKNNKIVDEITRAKLKYITIEDLKVSNMMKNKHLSKAIQEQNFYAIRTKLINKCKERNIELRLVDTFYPSSKTCSCCGEIKKDLKLNDRIYKCCNCGIEIDRDYNASINLEKAKIYKVIA